MTGYSIIRPDWPAPSHVHGFTTTREGGVSHGNYNSFNLAAHVGDSLDCVRENRSLLRTHYDVPSEPLWLQQVHGTRVVLADSAGLLPEADGSCTFSENVVCAVLTADCLPVLMCDIAGTRVAAVHAGWRGLAEGVIEEGIRALKTTPDQILVWLGPAMGPTAFEVGEDVYRAFVEQDKSAGDVGFTPVAGNASKWYADLYALARHRLKAIGIDQIYGGGLCTYSDPKRFYSFRRDRDTGRMATLIWLGH